MVDMISLYKTKKFWPIILVPLIFYLFLTFSCFWEKDASSRTSCMPVRSRIMPFLLQSIDASGRTEVTEAVEPFTIYPSNGRLGNQIAKAPQPLIIYSSNSRLGHLITKALEPLIIYPSNHRSGKRISKASDSFTTYESNGRLGNQVTKTLDPLIIYPSNGRPGKRISKARESFTTYPSNGRLDNQVAKASEPLIIYPSNRRPVKRISKALDPFTTYQSNGRLGNQVTKTLDPLIIYPSNRRPGKRISKARDFFTTYPSNGRHGNQVAKAMEPLITYASNRRSSKRISEVPEPLIIYSSNRHRSNEVAKAVEPLIINPSNHHLGNQVSKMPDPLTIYPGNGRLSNQVAKSPQPLTIYSSNSRLGNQITKTPEPLTIYPSNGRLGNQMFKLATLFGLAAINHRQMAIQPHTVTRLSQYFDLKHPLVDTANFIARNPWNISAFLFEQDRHIPTNSNIISGNYYPISFTFFHEFRKEVTELYSFRPHLLSHADSILNDYRTRYPSAEVFIGVHVRRGDFLPSAEWRGFLEVFQMREVDIEYFRRAVYYFKKRYANSIFLVVSDDRDWCRRNLEKLGMLVTPDNSSPGHDMALLSRCNHTVVTYGTFGFWGAYLAGGEAVYFSGFVKPDTDFAKYWFREDKLYLPEWVGISTTPPGYWNRTKKKSG